jgi:hypothetical protein
VHLILLEIYFMGARVIALSSDSLPRSPIDRGRKNK